MSLVVREGRYNSDREYAIPIEPPQEDIVKETPDDSTYPLRFCFTPKYIKQLVNDIKKFDKEIAFEKAPDSSLLICYKGNDGNRDNITYPDSAELNLKSTLGPDDILRVSVYLDHIRPYTQASIGTKTHIAIDKERPISFTTFLDCKQVPPMISIISKYKEYRNIIEKFKKSNIIEQLKDGTVINMDRSTCVTPNEFINDVEALLLWHNYITPLNNNTYEYSMFLDNHLITSVIPNYACQIKVFTDIKTDKRINNDNSI
jgi:hypothetical protein